MKRVADKHERICLHLISWQINIDQDPKYPLVVDAASRARVDAVLVAAVLGLTPAQSQVAALLAEGLSVCEVAAATGRQANAVYWLLKQIYKKLGVSRQADLVRLVLSAAELPGSGR